MQHLSNICWAFATVGVGVGVEADALFEAVAGEVERLVRDGKPQELTTIMWR